MILVNDNELLKQLFLDYYPVPGSIFEIALAKKCNKYCIVEGSDDRLFYSNVKNRLGKILFNNTYFIYQKHTNYEKILEGKERVLKSYQLIDNNNAFNKIRNKMFFIIDKDIDGMMKNIYGNISITKYYAFENYFFINDNLKKIFQFLKLTNNDYEKFEKILDYYINITKDFYKYSYTITFNYDKLKYQKVKKYNDSEILLFTNNDYNLSISDFNKNRFINLIKMKEELAFKKNIIDIYFLNDTMFKNSSIYTIKGHHLYSLLEKYLSVMHNIDISNKNQTLYASIVKELFIEMDFINSLGEKI